MSFSVQYSQSLSHFARIQHYMEEEKVKSNENNSETGSTHLNSFLTDLVNLQEKKLVKEADLDSLVEKHQLSAEDHEKLNMLVERHLSRAFEYKHDERWDNAIVETERALLFSPLDNEIRLDLAELFLNRSVQYGYLQKDLRRADREVQDALTLEPENNGAKKFEKELKQLHAMLQGKQNNKKIIPLILLFIVILGAALYPQIRKRFKFMSLNSEINSSAIPPSVPKWEKRSVPLIESDSLEKDFNINFTEATLIRETNAGIPALSIVGYLEPLMGDMAVLELELTGSHLQESIGSIEIISEGDAPLRKGESNRFNKFIYLNDDPEALESLFVSIKTRKAHFEETPPQWELEELFRENPLPQGVFVELESLFVNQIEGYDRNYLFYDLKVTNKSTESLKVLDLIYQWRDDQGSVISENSQSLVDNSLLPFKAQSAESFRIMFDVPKTSTSGRGDLIILLKKAEKVEEEES